MRRYQQDSQIRKKRLKFYNRTKLDVSRDLSEGRFNKRHPMDCGRTNCGLCSRHGPDYRDQRAEEIQAEQMKNLSCDLESDMQQE